jgi:hypothetical protein
MRDGSVLSGFRFRMIHIPCRDQRDHRPAWTDQREQKGAKMLTRMNLGLLAAALSVPLAAHAAPNNAPVSVVLLPVTAPMPGPMKLIVTPRSATLLPPMLSPAALLAPMLQMQAQLQAQMQASLADFTRGAPALPWLPTGRPGVTQISMVMISAPQGACAEQIQILPGADGHAQILARRFGSGCGSLPAALGKVQAGRQTATGQAYPGAERPMMRPVPMTSQPPATGPHLPPNALPPPSLLTYADYPMATRHPAAPHPAIAYRPIRQK